MAKKQEGESKRLPLYALVRETGDVGTVVQYHGWNRFRIQFKNGERVTLPRKDLLFTNNPNKKLTK